MKMIGHDHFICHSYCHFSGQRIFLVGKLSFKRIA